MTITKEQLTARKEELLAQKNQLVANLNAIAGAVQQIELLIAGLDTPDAEKKES